LKPYIDLPRMAEKAQRMVKESLDAFVARDTELARRGGAADSEGEGLKEQIFRQLLHFIMADPPNIARALPPHLIPPVLEPPAHPHLGVPGAAGRSRHQHRRDGHLPGGRQDGPPYARLMTWVYAGDVSPERRYQLQNAEANQQIDALLERLRVPGDSWRLESELVTTALKLFEDHATVGELKISNSALKELRYGFKVVAPDRGVPRVRVCGSARTPADHGVSDQARRFGRRMVDAEWMVVTGAGSGVMGAAQEGAGRERSFGLNIRLPFEQDANPW